MTPINRDTGDDDEVHVHEHVSEPAGFSVDWKVPITFAVVLALQTVGLVSWGSSWATKTETRLDGLEQALAQHVSITSTYGERLTKIETARESRGAAVDTRFAKLEAQVFDVNDRRIVRLEDQMSALAARLTKLENQVENNTRILLRNEDRLEKLIESEQGEGHGLPQRQ
jgi:flagellar biosynthesis chaperone FliJ